MFMLIRKMMFMNASESRKKKSLIKMWGIGMEEINTFYLWIKTEEEILGDGISGGSVEVWELLS